MTRRGFLARAAALPPALALERRQKEAGRDAGFGKFFELYAEGVKRHGIIGSSFMFLHDNQVVAKRFLGEANLEKKQRVDERTIYHWASITKTFTAVAIMQLRDRKRLQIDDPIVKYLPELRAVHNPHGAMEEITLRHLLSHSAGFRDSTWPWGGDKPWHPHEPRRWEQIVAMLPYTEILFKPGSRYSYSNPGIIFLGRVIEILSGDDYEVYIDKNIFKPLEMYRSYFDATPYHLLNDRSHSYYRRGGKLEPARFDVDTGITVSNGGLNAPLGDMVKYLGFLLGGGARSEVYDGVLSRATLAEMWQPQVSLPASSDGRGRRDWMGLSFFIEENYGQRFIGHSGGQNGFITHFYIQPETRAGYLIAFNTHGLPERGVSAPDTRLLDRELKEYLFENLFPRYRA